MATDNDEKPSDSTNSKDQNKENSSDSPSQSNPRSAGIIVKRTTADNSNSNAKAPSLDNTEQTTSEPVNSPSEVSPNPLSNPTVPNEPTAAGDNDNVSGRDSNDRNNTQDSDSKEDSIDTDIATHDEHEWAKEFLTRLSKRFEQLTESPNKSVNIVFKDYNIPHGHKERLFGDDQIRIYKTNMRKTFVLVNSALGLKIIDLDPDDTAHKEWLYYCLRTGKDEIDKEKDKKAAFRALESVADKEGDLITQEQRIYKEDDKIYYDLGDQNKDRYLILSKEGYKIINALNLRFVHFDTNNIQVDPDFEGSLNLLDKYVNLTGDDLFMLKIYLLAAYIPDIQHPILALLGGERSGKTTIAKCLVKLIDPSISNTLSKPIEIKSLYMNFLHHYFVAYDNLSEIEKSLSDELCRVVTGSSPNFRKLFTDSKAVAMDFQRAFIITGLIFDDLRCDLIDRFLIFNLRRITKSNKMTDTQRNSSFDEEKPKILGAIFNTIIKAMSIIESVDIDMIPRFEDFQKWGYALAEVLEEGSGERFLHLYQDKMSLNQETKESNIPLVLAVNEFMKGKDTWRGNMTELMGELQKKAVELRLDVKTDEWPGGSNKLFGKLKQHSGLLFEMGLEVNLVQKASRTYEIRRIPEVEDQSTPETT